jgi:aminoglycoside phosphotransferase (APT) family kinase protein
MASLLEAAYRALAAVGDDVSIDTVVFERPDRAVAVGRMSGEAVYVKADTSRERIASERAALAVASGGSLPVPRVVAEATASDAYVLVIAAIDGNPLDTCSEQAWVDAGSLLARLHRLRPPPDMGRARYGPADLHQFIDGALETARSSGAVEDAALVKAGAQLGDLASRVDCGVVTFVHSDLQPEHVLVGSTGRIVGIVDWADAGTGDPLFDLAVLTLWDADRLGAVVAGYGNPPAPSDEMRTRIGMYWTLRHLASAGWLAAHGYDPSPHARAVGAGVVVPELR